MRKIWLFLLLSLCSCHLLLAQENLVQNPGFEAKPGTNNLPSGGWWPFEGRGSATASLDTTVARSGEASLLIKGDAGAKYTFVSQKFEVAPGDDLRFEAWVRANAPTNGTASAGIAFRNRENTVIHRDYFNGGTLAENWSLISGAVKAPAESVSAEVHLRYTNGPVPIWYDDVVAVITNTVSLTLLDGAKPWPGKQEITVKVTNRSANDFRGTLSCAIGNQNSMIPAVVAAHKSRTLKLPITLNGVAKHRYKLSLDDASGNAVRELSGNFQTVPPLTLFPVCPCYLVANQGDGTVRVDARVNTNPALRHGMKLIVQVEDGSGKILQTATANASKGELAGCPVKVPVDQPATFTIQGTLVDSAGKNVSTDTTEVHVAAEDASIHVGPDGFLRVGGKPHFPIGMYNCGRFSELGEAGFSATHEYGIVTGEAEEPINQNERRVQDLLDKSWSNGLRVMIELPRKAIEQARWEQVRRRIETFKHHPGLLCWGSEERVARGVAPLENIATLYKLVHELDPNHPLVLGDTRDVVQKLQVDRRNFFPDPDMDIGIWWWYPIPLKDPDGNGLSRTGNPNLLEPPSWLATTLSKKPLWIATQAYQQPWKTSRFPTPDEYRCQAYLSIINNVKGLFLYVGYGQKDYLGKPSGILNKPEEGHWDYVKKLAGELREFSPVIMSPHASGEFALSPTNAPVEFSSREANGKIYLITANKSPKPQQVSFSSPLLKGRQAQVLYEQHSVQVNGDILTDEFVPFGVHIYELSASK